LIIQEDAGIWVLEEDKQVFLLMLMTGFVIEPGISSVVQSVDIKLF